MLALNSDLEHQRAMITRGLSSGAQLDGRNEAIAIAESPVRVIAAIQITSVRWLS